MLLSALISRALKTSFNFRSLRWPTYLLLWAFLGLFFAFSSQAAAFRNVKEGAPAPEINLKDLEGKSFSLSSFKGKMIVLVVFWDSSQAKAKQSLEQLQKIYGDLKPKGLEILAVAADARNATQIKEFKTTAGLAFPVLLDEQKAAYSDYGVVAMPSVALIDKDGIVKYTYSGFRHDFSDSVKGEAEVVLGLKTREQREAETKTFKRAGYVPKGRAEEYYHAGATLLRQKELDKAMAKFQEAVKEDPNYPLAQMMLGEAYYQKRDAAKAVEHLQKALEQDPNLADAYVYLGEAQLKQNKVDEAIANLQKGIEKNKRSFRARTALGAAYLAKKMYNEALTELDLVLRVNPHYPEAHYRLGQVYEAQNQMDKALASYKTALKYALAE